MKNNIKHIAFFIGLSSIAFLVLSSGKKCEEVKSVTINKPQIVETIDIKSNSIQRKKASKLNSEASISNQKVYTMSMFTNEDIDSIANEVIQLPEED
jgi:cell division protein YceG involved in septum cleavage